MSEQTLLLLFVVLVAAAAVSMAIAAAAVAWAAVKLLTEVRLFVEQMRRLGRTGEEALRETKERFRSAARSLLPGNRNSHGKNKQ